MSDEQLNKIILKLNTINHDLKNISAGLTMMDIKPEFIEHAVTMLEQQVATLEVIKEF